MFEAQALHHLHLLPPLSTVYESIFVLIMCRRRRTQGTLIVFDSFFFFCFLIPLLSFFLHYLPPFVPNDPLSHGAPKRNHFEYSHCQSNYSRKTDQLSAIFCGLRCFSSRLPRPSWRMPPLPMPAVGRYPCWPLLLLFIPISVQLILVQNSPLLSSFFTASSRFRFLVPLSRAMVTKTRPVLESTIRLSLPCLKVSTGAQGLLTQSPP